MLFPSLGENYGYVIIESLLSGTPVLSSKHVPWSHITSRSFTSLPLVADDWIDALEQWHQQSVEDRLLLCIEAHRTGSDLLTNDDSSSKLSSLFWHSSKPDSSNFSNLL